jgi:hypothetical protein
LATIEDRSRMRVKVKGHPRLNRIFLYSNTRAAQDYLHELREKKGHKEAQLTSTEDWFLVRIREKGYPEQGFFCQSFDEAEATAQRIEAERHTGLYKDYTRGHRITLAEVIKRFYF